MPPPRDTEAKLPSQRTRPPRRELDEIRTALSRYRTEFILLLTPRGEIVTSAEGLTFGYGDDEFGQAIAERVHPDDMPAVLAVVERARTEPEFRETIHLRGRRADDRWGTFEMTVMDASRDLTEGGVVLRVRDVTDEVHPSAVLAPGTDRFQSLAAALPLGLLSADTNGWVVFSNHTVQQIFNLSAEELMGRGWEDAVHPDDQIEVLTAAEQVIAYGLPSQVIFRVHTAMFARWAHAKFVPLGGPERTLGWIATVDDITDRRRAESQLAHQATHDPLTKLPNRLLLEDRLRQACARLRRGTDSVSVLFIDLDGFKSINDTLGHQAGDRVLVEVAQRVRRVVRDVDTVARFAGDEFVVVCEGIKPNEIPYVVRRIARAVDQVLVMDGHEVHVGASIGVATTFDPDMRLDDLLALADQDMYRKKRSR
jgi:diguanylate cyclase (GGDEF)-like protein/PAS domain S-box-containing protein